MITEIVEVVKTSKDKITVKFLRKPMCANCKLHFVCGKESNDLVDIENTSLVLNKGDKVEIGIEEKKSLLISCLIFLVPVALFVAILVAFNGLGELISFALAVIALFCYYFLMRIITKRVPKYFSISLIRKINTP